MSSRRQPPWPPPPAAGAEVEPRPTQTNGYDVAYRIPALQRVIQTGGRVIRSENDQGIVLLVYC